MDIKVSMTDNLDIRNNIVAKLKANNNYCPCAVEENADTKCMCKAFREQIERKELGECHCGLYQIVEA